jgi:hypothetical protein
MNVKIQIIYPGENSFSFLTPVHPNDNHQTILERIFAEWNYGSNQESTVFRNARVRSLSVNDIVRVGSIPGDAWTRYYQCESIGWTTVNFDYVSQLIEEVAKHPKLEEGGAYYALSDIMWRRKQADQTVNA